MLPILFHSIIFSREVLDNKLNVQKQRDIRRALINCYCRSLKKLIGYLNAYIELSYNEQIYNNYLAKEDYNSRQIQIIRKDDEKAG